MRNPYLITTLFLLTTSHVTPKSVPDIFNSLTTIEQYAASLEENPQIPIADWENPDFSAYHKKINPSLPKRFFSWLGFITPQWDIYSFSKLLDYVTTEREYAGFKAPFIYKLEPTPGKKFIIFGNLFGAFHSLVRDLRSLQEQNIIDEQLKIIDPDCSIIFNGNEASRSAYALETLTVILRLLYANKQSVFLTLGTQEMDNFWQQYAIKRELKSRSSLLNQDRIPMGDLIKRFFNTVPAALYLVAGRTEKYGTSVVRISNVGFESKEFSSLACGNFFENPDQEICRISPEEQQPSTTSITIQALIRGDPIFRTYYSAHQGLVPAGKENGTVTWSTMSCPIQSSQELFQFYYDTYVKLTTATSLDDWTLTLYNRDIREFEKIKPVKTFKLVSRQELNPQETAQFQLKIIEDKKQFFKTEIDRIDKKIAKLTHGSLEDTEPIRTYTQSHQESTKELTVRINEGLVPLGNKKNTMTVASIVDMSGFTKFEGESIETGIKIIFDKINKKGGIHNTLLDFISFDSRNQPDVARKAVLQALQQHNTGLILVPLSTAALEAYLDLIEKKQVLVLFPSASGGDLIQKKNLTNLFFMRASGQQEAYTITNYVAQELGGKRFAFFYENNSFGKTSIAGAQQALKKLYIKDHIAIPFEENNLNFAEQIKKIKEFQPDALGLFTIQAAAKELMSQIGSAWLIDKKLFGTQDLSPRSFRHYIERNQLTFVCTSIVPNPEGSLEITEQYKRDTQKMDISNDIYCLEGYIGADFFTYVLENITQPITSTKITSFLENIHNLPYKGLTFDFDPERRQLLHSLWIITGAKDWKEVKLAHTPTEKITAPQEIQKKINIGSTVDLTRGDSVLGNTIKRTMEYLIDANNKNPKRTLPYIDLTILDNEYSPEKARKQIESLIHTYNTDIILFPAGSQPYLQYIDYVKNGNIITIFPIPGVPGKRYNLPHCVFLGVSYYDEARVLTQYCIEKKHPQKVAIFYQDDLFGQALYEGAKDVLEEAKIAYTRLAYDRNLTNFSKHVDQIKKINPDIIGLFATPEASMELLRQLGDPYIKKIQCMGPSTINPQPVQDFIKKNEINCVFSNKVPDPADPTLQLSTEFQETMKKAYLKADTTAFEIYIGINIFLEILSRIKGPIDKKSVIEEFEHLHNESFKGLRINFDPATRQLLDTVWINENAETPWIPIQLDKGVH